MVMPMRDVTSRLKGDPVPKAKKKPAAKPRAYWSKRADRLWGELIHLRDREQCQFCGKTTGKKDAHHILPRTFKATRWLPENGVLLCPYPCHQTVAHGDPFTAVLHYERLRGDRYRELREQAYAGAKHTVQDLRDICAELERAVADVR